MGHSGYEYSADQSKGGPPRRFPARAATKQPFSLSDPCFEKGVTIQYNETAAKKAHEDVKLFLKDTFAQK